MTNAQMTNDDHAAKPRAQRSEERAQRSPGSDAAMSVIGF
jgi:hypothetical protein